MKKPSLLVTAILVLALAATLLLGGCSPAGTAKLKVVTSTSMMAQTVERVGGNQVDVVNIIPPAQCPGHFDVKPGDIQRLAEADLFLLHGWQGEIFSQDLIASANNPDLTVVTVDIEGLGSDWMTPPGQLAATDKISAALCQVDAENSAVYHQLAIEYKDKISAKEAVMCADMQAGFVDWVGLNLVATYGRPDSLTPQVVRELVDRGREAGVSLIIDNLQSGQDAGKGIAEELGCRRIILSNFPGGFDDTDTWEKAIDRNIELILGAMAQ
jgi:zinc transport system substrate-binding protein